MDQELGSILSEPESGFDIFAGRQRHPRLVIGFRNRVIEIIEAEDQMRRMWHMMEPKQLRVMTWVFDS